MKAYWLATAAALAAAGCTTVPGDVESAPAATAVSVEDAVVSDLVSRMSLERKVAQLIQPQINSFTACHRN